MASALLGNRVQLVKEEDDALTISTKPNELRARAMKARNAGGLIEIDTYEDHRMAMSLAVAGFARPGVVIRDPGCTAKTYPRFFDDLARLAGG